MDQSRTAGMPSAGAKERASNRYVVVIEMLQVFTEEIEVVADTEQQARMEAQAKIDADALGHLEFQDLESTQYRVASARRAE